MHRIIVIVLHHKLRYKEKSRKSSCREMRGSTQLSNEEKDEQMERENIFNSSNSSSPALEKPGLSDIVGSVTSNVHELINELQPQSCQFVQVSLDSNISRHSRT